MFKNLMFQTRHNRVAGIGNTKGSQRAMNLLFAIRDIQHRTGRDLGATFLSGTVVVNALTELYVMFKYLRPRELKRQQISCFDAWAAIFTKKTADYELNVTGAIKRKERFRTYIKVPELAMFLREITDYRTADMIHLDVPEKNVRFLFQRGAFGHHRNVLLSLGSPATCTLASLDFLTGHRKVNEFLRFLSAPPIPPARRARGAARVCG